MKEPEIKKSGSHILLPGMASAHSHAFQRALRGRTQRKPDSSSSFWSWRALMYELVTKLKPEDVYHISRFAYAELLQSGVTSVGEFHYIHHQTGGQPYADRLTLAEAVIQAAKDVGIRVTLIRTAYLRGGFQQKLEPAQQRFSDPSADEVLQDVELLRSRYKSDPMVEVALAAHSIRAVPIEATIELAANAQKNGLRFHMHVAEQNRELEECKTEYGLTPVALLAHHDLLSRNFVAIHATHLNKAEIKAIGAAGAFVCLCRTTERDLGDGLPWTADLAASGAKLCVGVDSHCGPDAFEEIRAVECDDRSRTERRTVAAEAPELMEMAIANGYSANGMAGKWQEDKIHLDANDYSLAGISDELLSDIVIFAATPRAIDSVTVAGKVVVENGRHLDSDEIRQKYLLTMNNLGLGGSAVTGSPNLKKR